MHTMTPTHCLHTPIHHTLWNRPLAHTCTLFCFLAIYAPTQSNNSGLLDNVFRTVNNRHSFIIHLLWFILACGTARAQYTPALLASSGQELPHIWYGKYRHELHGTWASFADNWREGAAVCVCVCVCVCICMCVCVWGSNNYGIKRSFITLTIS